MFMVVLIGQFRMFGLRQALQCATNRCGGLCVALGVSWGVVLMCVLALVYGGVILEIRIVLPGLAFLFGS